MGMEDVQLITAEELTAGDFIVDGKRLIEVREIRRPGKVYVEGTKISGKHGCTGIHVNNSACYPPTMHVEVKRNA